MGGSPKRREQEPIAAAPPVPTSPPVEPTLQIQKRSKKKGGKSSSVKLARRAGTSALQSSSLGIPTSQGGAGVNVA